MKEQDKKEGVVNRYFENDAIKIVFEITNQRMTNISIDIKEEDLYPKIEINDKRRVISWLNNFSTNISQYLSSAPIEMVRKNDDANADMLGITPSVCPRCNGKDLEIRGKCCGGKGNILVCSSCGIKLRVKNAIDDEGNHQ